jgi:hypothetical protein
VELDDRIAAPFATQFSKIAKSAALSHSGLSMKIGTPASTNDRARATCSPPTSVAISTASTAPIMACGVSTTRGTLESADTCSASFRSSQNTSVTRTPSIPNASGRCAFKYAGIPGNGHSASFARGHSR